MLYNSIGLLHLFRRRLYALCLLLDSLAEIFSTRIWSQPPLLIQSFKLFVDSFQLADTNLFARMQDLDMLPLQLLKIVVQPLMPWVQNEDLEA